MSGTLYLEKESCAMQSAVKNSEITKDIAFQSYLV